MVVGSAELLAQAETAYDRVVLDHARYAPLAADVVTAARRTGEPEALVVGLRAAAWVRHVVLDNAGAKRLLDEAVRLAVRHRLHRRLGEVLVTRAVALQELGRYAPAARDLRRAGPLVAAHERAEVVLQEAILEHNAGRVVAAVALYRRVLNDNACPPVEWAKAANNLSVAETQLGRPEAALYYLDRAAALADQIGPRLTAIITNSRAWSSFHAGRVAESIRRFEEAGRQYAAAGLPLGEHLLDFADALVDLRLLDEAAAVARAATAEFDRHGARLMAAEARLRCARLALELGDAEVARTDAESAIRDLRQQRRTAWVARATTTAVRAGAARHGYSPDSLARLRRAAATLQRLGLRADAVDAHLAAGRAALALDRQQAARRHLILASELAAGQPLVVRLQGRLAVALFADRYGPASTAFGHCRAGLADLGRHRAALPSVELRVLAAGHGAELGALGLRSLMPSAPASRAVAWLERTRAAALLSVQPPDPGVDEDVVALRNVVHQIRAARRQHGAEPPDLLARQRALESRIRRRSWSREGPAEGTHEVASASEMRRLLEGGWLVEYAAVDERILAVVVEPHRTRLIETGSLKALRMETDALLFALRRMLRGGRHADRARAAARDSLATLSALLLTPAAVPADVPLVVVPSGPFLRVPWSPLRDAPVTVAPSGTLWARGRRQRTPDSGRAVLVAGPGLPGAAAEIVELRGIYPHRATLLPPDSTVDATVDLIAGADVAHLACHGRFRSDSPLFSALELSDGPLTLHEMLSRGVAPRRVVLAACDSGVERGYDGDEVLGFASALMARGTVGVVASGVPLPDGVFPGMMTVLHQEIHRGSRLPQALHRARSVVAASDSPADYVAWCGLTAYGAG